MNTYCEIGFIYKQIKVYRTSELQTKFNALLDLLEEEMGEQKKTIMVLTRYNWQLQRIKQWCEDAGRACLIRERGAFFKSPAVQEFCAFVEAFLYYSEPMYLFNFLRTAYCYKSIDTEKLESLSGSKYKLLVYFMELIKEDYKWDEVLDEFRNRPVMSVLCELIARLKPSITYGAIQKQNYMIAGYDIEEGLKQAILDAKQYEADLQKLFQMLATSFSDEFSSLADICNYLRIRINTDTEEEPAEIPDLGEINCVQGSTVHSAKWIQEKCISCEADYIKANRRGRGSQVKMMSETDKKRAWSIYQLFLKKMREERCNTWPEMYLYINEHIKNLPQKYMVDYVFVDEAQDMTLGKMRALKAIARKSITIAADMAQKIYKTSFTWRETGIDIQGRASKSLTKTFRSTMQIVALAEDLALIARKDESLKDELTEAIYPDSEGPIPSLFVFRSKLNEETYT